jgi:threonine/homoserine/homoserine lactone efflux protein
VTISSAILSFAIVAGLLTIVPGLDTALVLRAAITQGARNAFATALGIATGSLIWGVAAAVGISALLSASTAAYTVVRIAGSLYLIWMGIGLLRKALNRSGEDQLAAAAGSVNQSAWRAWSRGTFTNLLNPKIGAFYVAVLPQFIPAHTSHLLMGVLLALVHDVEGMIWFTGIILAAGRVRVWLARRSVQRSVDGATGVALVGFGVKLGLSAH